MISVVSSNPYRKFQVGYIVTMQLPFQTASASDIFGRRLSECVCVVDSRVDSLSYYVEGERSFFCVHILLLTDDEIPGPSVELRMTSRLLSVWENQILIDDDQELKGIDLHYANPMRILYD